MFRNVMLTFILLWMLVPAQAQSPAKALKELKRFPSYPLVIEEFHRLYDVSDQGEIGFSRKPTGWFVSVSRWVDNQMEEVSSACFWDARKRKYLPLDLPSASGLQIADAEQLPGGHLMNAFRIHPYFGYKGWDKDIIETFGKSKQLPDSVLYALGRAYSNMAQGFIRPQYDFHYQTYTPAGYERISKLRTDSFLYCVNQSIEMYSRLAARNPDFQTIVGNIGVKRANECMYVWLSLKSVKDERADNFLKEAVYSDFWRKTAMNYLASCDSGAILFTGGDNDTYPLWYVQQVMNFRRDVRVVNLTLLNMNWYADMLRDSQTKAIKLSLQTADYHNKLDYAWVIYPDDNTAVSYQSVNDAIAFLRSDNPDTKLKAGEQAIPYFPQPGLMIRVDKANVVQSGILSASESAEMQEFIGWQLEDKYLVRSQILMLDIIATNNWKSPVSFSTGIPVQSLCGLGAFARFDGMVFTLMPFRAEEKHGMPGSINSDRLRSTILTRFDLENLVPAGSQPDEIMYGMVGNYRFVFSRLISVLIDEDNKDAAASLVDICDKAFPPETFPYFYTDLLFVECMLKTGKKERCAQISEQIAEYHIHRIQTFRKMPANHPDAKETGERMESALMLLNMLGQMLEVYGEQELATSIRRRADALRH